MRRIAIGHSVNNTIDNSAAIRGTLYLDGATGIMYRATFGSGAWTAAGFNKSGSIRIFEYNRWNGDREFEY